MIPFFAGNTRFLLTFIAKTFMLFYQPSFHVINSAGASSATGALFKTAVSAVIRPEEHLRKIRTGTKQEKKFPFPVIP